MSNDLVMRDGRRLEVQEYGDPAGHPVVFFHGLVGSHHQASYVAEEAREKGLRIIAPNRPGVGRSEFTARSTPLDAVPDVEDLAHALKLDEFSVIGLSGGAPYALATLDRLGGRVRTATVISGMGPLRLPGGLRGLPLAQRLSVEIASRYPNLARRGFRKWNDRFRENPQRFLDRLVLTWPSCDRKVFANREIYDLFLLDMRQVFTEGNAVEGLSQEMAVYRNFGFPLEGLPPDRPVIFWHGLADTIVPPAMTWEVARRVPESEAHFVQGGHFVAVDIADQIIDRLKKRLDAPACSSS